MMITVQSEWAAVLKHKLHVSSFQKQLCASVSKPHHCYICRENAFYCI